jgi:ferredoxin-NADP reductase
VHITHDEIDLRLRIDRRETLAEGIVGLSLRDQADRDLPLWAPGAHTDVTVGPGMVRQYSLWGDPADRTVWRIAVLREEAGSGGSEHVHDALREGDVLDARGPRNNFEFAPSRRYLFIAGGIGITPILPMAAVAAASGAEWHLHYCGRSRAKMAFAADLSEAYGACVSLYPRQEVGRLHLESVLAVPDPDTLVYCCGPEVLLREIEERCASWPRGALRVERFAPKPRGEPLRSEPFEVELAQSAVTLTVPPDKSILEVIEEAGIPVMYSCREGTCGTCETVVLEGAVDHRDSLLTAEEQEANDVMFICVSRAAGPRLVLDL